MDQAPYPNDAPPTPGARAWRQGRAAIATYTGVFAVTLLVFGVFSALAGWPLATILTRGVPAVLGDAIIALLLFPALSRTQGMRPGPRWVIVAMVAVLVATLQSSWDIGFSVLLGQPLSNGTHASFLRVMPLNTYHTGMLVTILAMQRAWFTMLEQQHALRIAREGERAARLASLRFQLNPHFLFNTMNALSGLVVTRRTDVAEQMIERLTTFLRAALAADPDDMVSLAEEFDMLEAYLDIEHVRFGDRLALDLTLAPELADVRVPPFLLQPLVENAMKYAVAPTRERVTVTVTAARDGPDIVLAVADDGPVRPQAGDGTKLGLANVRTRLQLEYGAAADLSATALPRGFRVEIRLQPAAARA